MHLIEIILCASGSYPDDAIMDAHKRGDAAGDTLALFIAREIAETYEPTWSSRRQLELAIAHMEKARGEIDEVMSGLRRKLERTK